MNEYWETIKNFNSNIWYFLISGAVHGFVYFGIYALLLNIYLLRLGYEPTFIGLVNGLGPLMLAVFSLPAGVVSRRWGSRRVMLWSYVGIIISFGLLPLSEWLPEVIRPTWIIGSYVMAWICSAFLIVNFGPYMMAWSDEEERNHVFAIQAASLPVAGFLGSFLGGTLPNLFARLANVTLNSPIPYRNALLVAAAIELLTIVALMQTAEAEVETDVSITTQSIDDTPPPYRLIILFSLVNLLAVAGEWTMRVYFNIYLDSVLATPITVIGILSASAQVMGLTAFLAPQAAARWGRNRVVRFGLVSVFIAFIPWIMITHWLAVGVGYVILVAVLSITYPLLGVFGQSVVEPRWRTMMSSAGTMSIGVGIALTSLGGGYVIAISGYRMLFVLGASASLIGAGVVWLFLPHESGVEAAPIPESIN